MGVVEIRLATFLKRSNFSGNFEQLVDRANIKCPAQELGEVGDIKWHCKS